MANNLKNIWSNRKQILEGITNSLIRDEFVEDVARVRRELCDQCSSKGNECVVVGTGPCCNECGCSLGFKTRALSTECPLGKWKALISEEDEDKLDNLKD
jgi:hypothetical protein